MRRRRARLARPRFGASPARDGFAVRFALTAIAPSRRDDAALDVLVRFASIRIRHRQMDTLCNADGQNATLSIVSPVIHALENGLFKDQ
jgi:hypothetical protein